MIRTMPCVRLALLLALPFGVDAQEHEHRSPYSGLEDREVKALSAEDVDGLLRGEGMEMALPAELNGYPGPRHVLDLADELGLTPSQREAVRSLFEAMNTRARELGRRIVALERELDSAFAARTITSPGLRALLEEIGRARAELRGVHLQAHLALDPVLTGEQRVRYARLRGYHRP